MLSTWIRQPKQRRWQNGAIKQREKNTEKLHLNRVIQKDKRRIRKMKKKKENKETEERDI